ncbi:MAG: preprotein translocase subunit SecE [Candidatus Saccharibacteria bacterium]|nr:preprotein translocase subunit SecE [Candidatus Saccharibacteria bacterium]
MAKAKITRIKANDSKKTEKTAEEPVITRKKVVLKDKKVDKKDKQAKKAAKKAEKAEKKNGKKPFILFRPFCFIGRYFKESWQEIRQVRWPNRKATWKMVFAVLVYTAFFVLILVLLDMLFKFIFNSILG